MEYLQQLYLIVDRFSHLGCEETLCTPSALSDDFVQRFTHRPTDRHRHRIVFLNNIDAVLSTTSRMTGFPLSHKPNLPTTLQFTLQLAGLHSRLCMGSYIDQTCLLLMKSKNTVLPRVALLKMKA